MGSYPDNEEAVYTENDMETLRNMVRKLTHDAESYRKTMWCLIEASGGEILVPNNILGEVGEDCIIQRNARLDINATVYKAKRIIGDSNERK